MSTTSRPFLPQGSHQSRERRAGGSLGTLPGKSNSAYNAGGRIWNKSLSDCRTKSFCCTELKFSRCWLHRLYIIPYFCFNLNKISGVIRLLVSSGFFCVTLGIRFHRGAANFLPLLGNIHFFPRWPPKSLYLPIILFLS